MRRDPQLRTPRIAKRWLRVGAVALALASCCRGGEELFDRIEEALMWSAADGQFRSRLSGILDLEAYAFQSPAPGLLPLGGGQLLNPRLTAYLDAQWGTQWYFFLQSRVDRGFDPARSGTQVRFDEYALRFTPWKERRLSLQVGKFASVVGNWIARHESWPNPFITAPLPYENLTGMWDSEAIGGSGALLKWSHVRPGLPPAILAIEKALRLPIVWGPAYGVGIALGGEIDRFRYALEIKNSAVSSRPSEWSDTADRWTHPTLSTRLGYRLNEMWNFGFSASAGPYLRSAAKVTLPPGRGYGDYRQTVLAHDVSFAWHHLQLWSEIFASRFEIPGVGQADTLAYFAEAKYKFGPRFSGALRWNEQFFGQIQHLGAPTRWGYDLWRIDFAPTWRLSPHAQLKLQYSLQHGDSAPRRHTRTIAGQVIIRF